MLGGDDAVPG
jgi:hypothetical protein